MKRESTLPPPCLLSTNPTFNTSRKWDTASGRQAVRRVKEAYILTEKADRWDMRRLVGQAELL